MGTKDPGIWPDPGNNDCSSIPDEPAAVSSAQPWHFDLVDIVVNILAMIYCIFVFTAIAATVLGFFTFFYYMYTNERFFIIVSILGLICYVIYHLIKMVIKFFKKKRHKH